jgi:DNA-binding NtrC family response regulator
MNEHNARPADTPVVLVVEDDWLVKELLHDILEFEGFQVFAVETADEAWRFLVEGTCKVDLIFADIHLTGPLNGVDLANLAYKRWPGLPIILPSGSRGYQALEPGCTPVFVAKPWHSMDIGAVCRRALLTKQGLNHGP